jgi:hypothetical protein
MIDRHGGSDVLAAPNLVFAAGLGAGPLAALFLSGSLTGLSLLALLLLRPRR